MIDSLQPTNTQIAPVQTPDLKGIKNEAEMEKAARDFTSVFFNECVSKMLEEMKTEDEDFASDIYRSMFAQAIGEKLTDCSAGRSISNVILGDIIKMQEKLQGGTQI